MKKITSCIFLISVTLLTSCVLSLHPLYTSDKDTIFYESILGTWEDKNTGETWTFSTLGKSEYKLLYKDEDGRNGAFIARLVKVSDQLFLDMSPMKPRLAQNEFYQDHLLRTHTFIHVLEIGPTVSVAFLEPRWLKDTLMDRPDAIRHERISGEILLTSSTEETQKFLLANVDTPGAFSKPIELTRRRPAG